jgi:hypothetical protein
MFNFKPVSYADVRRIVLSFSSNKSPGMDKVPMSVIKECLSSILPSFYLPSILPG